LTDETSESENPTPTNRTQNVLTRQAADECRPHVNVQRRILAATLALMTAVALAGCGDPKEATKANFKQGLNAFFDKNCALLTPTRLTVNLLGQSPTTFPIIIQTAPMANPDTPRLVALAASGLLHQGAEQTTVNMFRQVEVSKPYTLTDKGKALWKPSNAMGQGSPAGFCAGHMQVDDVDSFTDPVVQGGMKVSTVSFRAHTVYDAWTQAPDVQEAFRNELSHTAPAPLTLLMVLMSDGWTISTAPAAMQ